MQSLPQINLDAFKVCFFQQWKPAEFSFITIATSFGAVLVSLTGGISDATSFTDFFAFFMIFVAARGLTLGGYSDIPMLLKRILQDATIYFFSMVACQLVLLFFLSLAPVG